MTRVVSEAIIEDEREGTRVLLVECYDHNPLEASIVLESVVDEGDWTQSVVGDVNEGLRLEAVEELVKTHALCVEVQERVGVVVEPVEVAMIARISEGVIVEVNRHCEHLALDDCTMGLLDPGEVALVHV